MKNKIKNFWLGLALLTMVLQPVLATAGIPEAATYLQAQSQSAWITMALAAAGQSGIPTGHLASVSGTLATDYAKVILALAAVGENPATFGSIDYVAQLKTYYQDNQMGSVDLLNDDMWSILALASVGEINSTEAVDAKNFVLANQNIDGGWSYAVGSSSDTNDTAAAIMALIEAGVSPSNSVITDAVAYLQTAQNADGGIGYDSSSDSDSGSDAWVISALYKAGINPTSWDQSGNNPVTHLESLQDTDGGFWWKGDGSEWDNKAMTSHAVIALAGKSHPIGYYQDPGPDPGTYHLRIEGGSSTICDTYVAGNTALDIIENGAEVCGYTYLITQEDYGPYLRAINDETAVDAVGWLYFVDNVSPPVGAADYNLQEGDEVLWFYGEWGWSPTRVSVDPIEIDPGQSVDVEAEYFDGSSWLPLAGADIKVNNVDYSANDSGQAALTIHENGVYQVYINTVGYVRSQKATVTVGDSVSQNVGLIVEVDQSGTGQVGGEAIALTVDLNQLNFGTLQPGESADQIVILTNDGTVDLAIGASVSGDSIFTGGTTINGSDPDLYSDSLVSEESKNATVTLTIPLDYLLSGIKNGELIFWGTAHE